MNNVIEDLRKLINSNVAIMYEISYDDFKKNYIAVKEILGTYGFIMFTDNRAVLCVDNYPNIRLIIKSKKQYEKSFFDFVDENTNIIGKGRKETGGSLKFFGGDLKRNIIILLLYTIVYWLILNPYVSNMEILMSLNSNLLTVVSIFVGMLFVFVGFFYGDKERSIETYKKGKCDEQYRIDRYTINLSLLTIVLLLISTSIGNIGSIDKIRNIISENIIVMLTRKNQYVLCAVISWLAVCLLILCFKNLIDFYLLDMRNKYFMQTVDELVNERKH